MVINRILKSKTTHSFLWLIGLLGFWEIASRCGWVPKYFLPPFSKVVENTFNEMIFGNLGLQTLNSLWVILIGFIIAFVIAIVIAALGSASALFSTFFTTLSTIFNPLPSVALLPLIILWFGIDTKAMIVIIVHSVLWVMVRQLLDGINSIPKVYYEWSENIELSHFRKFTNVLIMAILPELISGIRIGWGRAWRSLISAEMVFGLIGSLGGLGYYIYNARAYAHITDVMSGVVLIVIIGMFFESFLFAQLEKHTIKKWGMMHD